MIELAKEIDLMAPSSSQDGLNRESLSMLWHNIGMGKVDRLGAGEQIFEDAFLLLVEDESFENLDYSPGGWVLTLWDGATKSAILSALMWAMLSMAGYPQLPILVIPAVLPLLFDLKKSRLSASQECIHTFLVVQPAIRDKKHGADELYYSLPKKMQDELSYLDFIEFLEACYKSGLAEKHEDGDLTVFQKDNQVFRLIIE